MRRTDLVNDAACCHLRTCSLFSVPRSSRGPHLALGFLIIIPSHRRSANICLPPFSSAPNNATDRVRHHRSWSPSTSGICRVDADPDFTLGGVPLCSPCNFLPNAHAFVPFFLNDAVSVPRFRPMTNGLTRSFGRLREPGSSSCRGAGGHE
jgi:hypothetical protein